MRRGVTNAIYRRAESEILPAFLRIKRSGKEVMMSEKKVSIEQMAEAVMDGLIEYAGLATDVMKDCVTKAGNTVKSEVKANAPVRTGQYKKGWAVKKQKETANSLELVVHNKKRYQLTHLLEKGHAKRGGGRVRAFPHIAPAEQAGIRELEEGIKRGLEG